MRFNTSVSLASDWKIACDNDPCLRIRNIIIRGLSNGHVLVPNEIVVLLTLVLASRLEDVFEKNEVENTVSQTWTFDQRVGLEAAREDLKAQEKINHNLLPIIVRAGAIRFRYWWNTQERLKGGKNIIVKTVNKLRKFII